MGPVPVGTLTLLSPGLDTIDRTEFSFYEEYRSRAPRPVLGQIFEDDLSRRHSNRMRLPPFFSNLLPEGALRDLIAKRSEVSSAREFFLIAYLGEDLPGAVIVRPQGRLLADDSEEPIEEGDEEDSLRFSLAGVQLKFSMIREGRGLTLPVAGRGGDWILKLPNSKFEQVPENELSMMTWAKRAGINTPETQLVDLTDVRGLPVEVSGTKGRGFMVRRFDRTETGRVHIEDFAQVLGAYPARKYKGHNYETIAKILYAVSGRPALEEFLRRLIFIVAIGNADAHLKNWSLIYPDGVMAELSPAYDLVSTIQYASVDRRLGLNFAGSKRFEDVSMSGFERLAGILELGKEEVTRIVEAGLENIIRAWMALRADLPIPEPFKRRIEEHWSLVPLLRGRL